MSNTTFACATARSFVVVSGQRYRHDYCRLAAPLNLCGIILLTNAAIFILHILRVIARLFVLGEKVPELQQIVHTKC
jgi:hypothetical protein